MTLLDAKAAGADVRIVYSLGDAVKMANQEKSREFIFFSVGFETTAPSTAVEIISNPPNNFSFLISNRVIPPAMKLLVEMKELNLNGFIAPGHVSTIIGLEPYKIFPESYKIPTVVAGFEPLDILMGIYMILKQIKKKKPMLENEYSRVVSLKGNIRAQKIMNSVFDLGEGSWRGLGNILNSKFFLKKKYAKFDAHQKYNLKIDKGVDLQPGCKCHLIIIGKIKPNECSLFMSECTPLRPKGACMVSSEGTCKIWADNFQQK
jgi:hydrogenase expression/formation protein HypD